MKVKKFFRFFLHFLYGDTFPSVLCFLMLLKKNSKSNECFWRLYYSIGHMLSDIYTYPSAQVAWVPNKTTLKWGALTPSNFRERVVDIWSKSVALTSRWTIFGAPGPHKNRKKTISKLEKKKFFPVFNKKSFLFKNHF